MDSGGRGVRGSTAHVQSRAAPEVESSYGNVTVTTRNPADLETGVWGRVWILE